MIIGYDFWCDNVYEDTDEITEEKYNAIIEAQQEYENTKKLTQETQDKLRNLGLLDEYVFFDVDENNNEVWTFSTEGLKRYTDNDGVAFDTCNPITLVSDVKIENATYDELEILKDTLAIENDCMQNEGWTENTVLCAKFDGNLIGGTTGLYQNGKSYPIQYVQFVKRKVGKNQTWGVYKELPIIEGKKLYKFIDGFIENEQEYEYGIRPISYDDNNNMIVGEVSMITTSYIKYEYAYLLGRDNNDEEVQYTLIYNFKLGDITTNIDANMITTLSGQYPITIYGKSKYKTGNANYLLVTEESATGAINIATEKVLRNNISEFLSNKKPKVLKFEDGTYLLVTVSDNFVLTPDENLIGSYTLSFNYTEVGDVDDVKTLVKYGLIDNVTGLI